jgi:FAD dependent oxidoreductase
MESQKTKKSAIWLAVVCCAACLSAQGADRGIWIEAESFDTLGGWVIDQQSMGQMGSAYVMAHGMGVPVQDATTACAIPKSGEWTVWARTRDWTAPWKRGKPAGIFKILVNGQALAETLGTNGSAWDWQKAGVVHLEKGEARMALHDLTGFNGRCDAIYLTLDAQARPENEKQQLAHWRREIQNIVCKDDPVKYDLAVVGGGMAGICTAIAAIRTGSRVVLIQDRPVLGGNNSSEIRVGLGGFAQVAPYPKLGSVVTEIAPIVGGPGAYPAEAFEDGRKASVFRLCPRDRYKLVLNERVFAVEKAADDPHKITAVISRNIRTGAETRYQARLFADCTGDAVVSRLMGATVMYGRESRQTFNESLAPEKADNQVMGLSVIWYSKKADQPTAFPDVDWGITFNEGNAYRIRSGDWEWETGQYRNQAEETEYIRDYALMVTYANWSFWKNHSRRKAEWASDTLVWVSPLGGKRESYRVVGDHVLTQNDIENHVVFPDATGSITWSLDLHFPDPENARKFAEPFRSCAYHRGIVRPYQIPYRCLYAKDVNNLFLGGRVLSASHVAFAAVRVQRTLGMLGEVIGMAASICAKENACPRDVYSTHLDKLKAMMSNGVPAPVYHAYPCDTSETYHFKEPGFISVNPPSKQLEDPDIKSRIDALKVQHKQ